MDTLASCNPHDAPEPSRSSPHLFLVMNRLIPILTLASVLSQIPVGRHLAAKSNAY